MDNGLFISLSGIQAHLKKQDITGNNLANVNTAGFKPSHTQSAERAHGGVEISAIGKEMSQGALRYTGNPYDLAIMGNGFFAVEDGNGMQHYTRNGSFQLDGSGNLVDSNGNQVQGWSGSADPSTGEYRIASTTNPVGDIQVKAGTTIPGKPTSALSLAGNLDSNSPIGTQHVSAVDVYDSLGAAHNMRVTFAKTGVNEWSWSVQDPAPQDAANVRVAGSGTLSFKEDGTYEAAGSTTNDSEVGLASTTPPGNLKSIVFDPAGDGGAPPASRGAAQLSINPDFGSLTQMAGESSAEVSTQNGYSHGTLQSVHADQRGFVTGVYDNGQTRDIAQVAVVNFNNPAGLEAEGNSLYRSSANSGNPRVGRAGNGGRGVIAAGYVEMSTVNIAREMTDMMVNEKGLGASIAALRTKDEMLGEILDLKQ